MNNSKDRKEQLESEEALDLAVGMHVSAPGQGKEPLKQAAGAIIGAIVVRRPLSPRD